MAVVQSDEQARISGQCVRVHAIERRSIDTMSQGKRSEHWLGRSCAVLLLAHVGGCASASASKSAPASKSVPASTVQTDEPDPTPPNARVGYDPAAALGALTGISADDVCANQPDLLPCLAGPEELKARGVDPERYCTEAPGARPCRAQRTGP